jgi:hypothetical protein
VVQGARLTRAVLGRAAEHARAARGRPDCRHCGRPASARWRGLCARCWTQKAVRRLYPSLHKCGARPRNFQGKRLPDRPTTALPGTPEKVEAMARRAAQGRQLFHPLDPRLGGW